MKQDVFIIGTAIEAIVPFSQAFAGTAYDVTLVQTDDVVGRTEKLAGEHEAWFLPVLTGDEDEDALANLERLAPATSIAIQDGEDPIVLLAHLIAASSWDESACVDADRAEPATYKREEQHG